jgi:hypothetical protein
LLPASLERAYIERLRHIRTKLNDQLGQWKRNALRESAMMGTGIDSAKKDTNFAKSRYYEYKQVENLIGGSYDIPANNMPKKYISKLLPLCSNARIQLTQGIVSTAFSTQVIHTKMLVIPDVKCIVDYLAYHGFAVEDNHKIVMNCDSKDELCCIVLNAAKLCLSEDPLNYLNGLLTGLCFDDHNVRISLFAYQLCALPARIWVESTIENGTIVKFSILKNLPAL